MELATITMPKDEARKAFLEYRTAVRERHNDEDQAIMRGYKWLSEGKQVLSLRETMSTGGLDEKGLPKLAICRADAQWCLVKMGSWGDATFHVNEGHPNSHTRLYVRLADGTFPQVSRATRNYPWTARSMVPIIPPALRPTTSLENYHVLYEAVWEPVAPRDPALLRHLGGDLWACLATWDLTPLERAVLAGRRPNLP